MWIVCTKISCSLERNAYSEGSEWIKLRGEERNECDQFTRLPYIAFKWVPLLYLYFVIRYVMMTNNDDHLPCQMNRKFIISSHSFLRFSLIKKMKCIVNVSKPCHHFSVDRFVERVGFVELIRLIFFLRYRLGF